MRHVIAKAMIGALLLGLLPGLASATDSICLDFDLYLHRDTTHGLFLSEIPPSKLTPELEDSPILTRAGGDQWQLIGSWQQGSS